MGVKPLILNGLSKKYGDFYGLNSVSLEVREGEIFGFLGPNGAGKSTAIRTILNFMAATEGSVSIFGLDSSSDSVEAKHHIGYLAGDSALYENMTGHEVFKLLSGLGKKTDWHYVEQLLKRLEAQPNKKISTLSKGNKQKIGLIQAFMHKPDLLILDEPTVGLDPLMKQVFYDMVIEMRNEGKTIFLSSHDLSEVQKICDRAAFIRNGKLVAIEDVKNVEGLNLRRYVITFKKKPPVKALKQSKSVSDIKANGNEIMVTISGDIDVFIKELAKHEVDDLDEHDLSLEDLFMHYYERKKS